MNENTVFKISYGLYVLTAKEGDKHNGCIINTLAQVTVIPNRISITVNKDNYTHDMIERTGKFNVSIISEKADFELFKHFGFSSGRDTDKFKDYKDAKESANGLLYVTKGVNAYISGSVVSSVDFGTHTLFVADVVDADIIADDESATYAYYHKNIKPAPEKKSEGGWSCKICNYVFKGDELPADFICPLCKHGVVDFEKI